MVAAFDREDVLVLFVGINNFIYEIATDLGINNETFKKRMNTFYYSHPIGFDAYFSSETIMYEENNTKSNKDTISHEICSNINNFSNFFKEASRIDHSKYRAIDDNNYEIRTLIMIRIVLSDLWEILEYLLKERNYDINFNNGYIFNFCIFPLVKKSLDTSFQSARLVILNTVLENGYNIEEHLQDVVFWSAMRCDTDLFNWIYSHVKIYDPFCEAIYHMMNNNDAVASLTIARNFYDFTKDEKERLFKIASSKLQSQSLNDLIDMGCSIKTNEYYCVYACIMNMISKTSHKNSLKTFNMLLNYLTHNECIEVLTKFNFIGKINAAAKVTKTFDISDLKDIKSILKMHGYLQIAEYIDQKILHKQLKPDSEGMYRKSKKMHLLIPSE